MCTLRSIQSGCPLLRGGVKPNIFLSQCLNKTHLNVFTTAAKNKFDQVLETGHCSFSCSSGNVEYYTVKKQTGHILHGTVTAGHRFVFFTYL